MSLPSQISRRTLLSVHDEPVQVPDPDRLTHLQFRRFAGCPVCNLHLRAFAARDAEIRAANIREVVVFHSSATTLRTYTADLPFDVIPDPNRVLYREFGVESAPRALLDPRAWPTIARSIAYELRAIRRGEKAAPPKTAEGGRLGLPADFLITPDGTLLASKHGRHADDQWSVDELLALVPNAKGRH
ncbi:MULTISPECIES: peroxiredoxin-like family protein [unclassified Nocardia]|uniref:peroxiredoxin-like family protein n=1 Tax=unclassified Nocardia TaxID=2637762 RepID=UPI001CE42E36|nr:MULTISPECIES: peroxiredoxin-like family protein [unclassified Nocardia]